MERTFVEVKEREDQIKQKNIVVESQIVSLENVYRSSEEDRDVLEREVQSLQSALELTRASLDEDREELESLRSETQGMRNKVFTLETQLQRTEKIKEGLEQQVNIFTSKGSDIDGELIRLQRRVQEQDILLESQRKDLKNKDEAVEMFKMENRNLQNDVSGLQEEITSIRSSLDVLQQNKDGADKKLFDAMKQSSEFELRLGAALEEQEEINRELAEKQEKVSRLEQELYQALKDLANVRHELEDAKSRAAKDKEDIVSLQRGLNEKEITFEEYRKSDQEKVDKIDSLQSNVDKLEQGQSVVRDENGVMKMERCSFLKPLTYLQKIASGKGNPPDERIQYEPHPLKW